jgi:tetratricopeptide (TPR) repeat protein
LGKEAMSARATTSEGRLAQLWQLPLLLLSLLLFAVAGYLFFSASPGLTIRKQIDIARLYIAHERPEAALEQLNRLVTGEKLTQEYEATVHLLMAQALETAQRQRKISIAANHTRIIEQTQIALQMGIKPTGEIHRRLGESYQALGRPGDAVGQFRQAMVLDPARSLRLRRKIIEVQSAQEDGSGAMTALDEYLDNKTLTDAERAWAMGEKSQILADRGEFVTARTLISESLRLDSDPIAQAQANYRMAYCAWKLSKNEEAERLLRQARDQFPRAASARCRCRVSAGSYSPNRRRHQRRLSRSIRPF